MSTEKAERRLSVSFNTPSRSPSSVPDGNGRPSKSSLADPKVRYVRLCWVDFGGLLRFRVVPKGRYERMLESPPRELVTVTGAVMGLGANDEIAAGFGPVGELYLQPDKNSFRFLGFEPGHAMVMCNLLRKRERPANEFSPRLDSHSPDPSLRLLSAYPLCPRQLLSATLAASVVESGVSYLIGFELELVLLSAIDPVAIPIDGPRRNHAWSSASGLRSGSKGFAAISRIVESLEESGIKVEQWHAESAPGQFEIVLAPHAPFQAADELIVARETVHSVAVQMGCIATLTPKPFTTAAGNGNHTHISLHRRKKPSPSSSPRLGPFPSPSSRPYSDTPAISIIESHWLAGVLHHLPAICAFTQPSTFSYDRVAEGCWSGGVWVVWGTANREAPLRLCPHGDEHSFEIKSADATSNVYLALSAIITAGLLGIQTPLELLQPDCRVDAAKLSAQERAESRITTPMPRSISESLQALEKDSTLVKSLGTVFCRAYISVKKGEVQRYEKLTPKSEPSLHLNTSKGRESVQGVGWWGLAPVK